MLSHTMQVFSFNISLLLLSLKFVTFLKQQKNPTLTIPLTKTTKKSLPYPLTNILSTFVCNSPLNTKEKPKINRCRTTKIKSTPIDSLTKFKSNIKLIGVGYCIPVCSEDRKLGLKTKLNNKNLSNKHSIQIYSKNEINRKNINSVHSTLIKESRTSLFFYYLGRKDFILYFF